MVVVLPGGSSQAKNGIAGQPFKGCPEMAKSGCWQPTEAPHPVPKTLQKQGVSEIIGFQAGTVRIG
jgi:hypothetical protein